MNKVVNKLRKAKNAVFLHNLELNSKDFWKAIKCLNCNTSSVPTLYKNGIMANSNSEKCFSQHFNLSESPLAPDDLPRPIHSPTDYQACRQTLMHYLIGFSPQATV